jgi:anti-sigma factor RsiW
MTTHDEIQSLLGAFALDAVDADEGSEVEAHLVDCPRCRAEVTELREVAAMLSQSGADAPEGVWTNIAASLSGAPPPLRLAVVGSPTSEGSTRWIVARRAVAGVAAASIVVLGIGVIRLRNEVDDLRNGTADSGQLAAAATRALGAHNSRIAHLQGGGGDAVAVVESGGHGYFIGTSLPAVGPRLYQLWGQTSSGTITSLGTVPGPGVYAFSADASIHTVMVTVEDEPVPAPTSAPIASGALA